MRTMAGVWFSVIVLVSIQKVFGNVCLQRDENHFTCDECIRCSGKWCNERGSPHCKITPGDDWCQYGREYLEEMPEAPDKKGAFISPVYAQRTLYISEPNKIVISYSAKSQQKPNMTIVQSTQSFNIDLQQYDLKCSEATCVATIEATASQEFCNATGGVTESVKVKINVGLEEEAHIKYFVACACACSQKVERSSPMCNKNGNFSCGVCSCDPGWKGEYCDQSTICDKSRGDLKQCSLKPRNDEECSFNGYCGICESCICYTDRDGSQYFDQENNCQGLCSVASECEECLINNTIGECSKCIHHMTIQRYNESLTKERDAQARKIWVKCNETFDNYGLIEFFAMRIETREIFVMMRNHYNGPDAVVADTKVPIILGVLGIIAVVAAVSGIMLWKHMNTVPPVPLNDPQYQNIDAEDCTGENPLYKPPTSSFKNPTYGKW